MSYWTEVDPPMSFIPEGWTYEQKRAFRNKMIPYLDSFMQPERYAKERVLCIGDGGGLDAIEFAREGAYVNVVDMSEKAIALVDKHAAEAGVSDSVYAWVGDACNLRRIHNDGGIALFDAAYSFGVFHHIPDVDKAIAETARVLKPGGEFLGMVYHKDSLLYAYSIVARAAREGLTPDEAMSTYSERNPGCPHSVAYTQEEWTNKLRPHFSSISTQIYYDVIDLPNERKVKVEGVEGRDLGWHLIFRARKS